MKRREFIGLIGGAASIATLRRSAAAQSGRTPVVGVVRPNRNDSSELFREPFRSYMRALGWDDARNVTFQFRFADGQFDRLPLLMSELISLDTDVLVIF